MGKVPGRKHSSCLSRKESSQGSISLRAATVQPDMNWPQEAALSLWRRSYLHLWLAPDLSTLLFLALIYWSAWAAMTKTPQTGWTKQQELISLGSDGQGGPRPARQHVQALARASSSLRRGTPAPCLFSAFSDLPFFELSGWGRVMVTSFTLNYFLRGAISKCSHSGGQGFDIGVLERGRTHSLHHI